LWRAVYVKSFIDKETKKIKPSFFRNLKSGLSCDLTLLTSEKKCLHPWPPGSGIVQFSIDTVRGLGEGADVEHKPLKKEKSLPESRKNYAHSEFINVNVEQSNKMAEEGNYSCPIVADYDKLPKQISDWKNQKTSSSIGHP
jgi:hypothetical protein